MKHWFVNISVPVIICFLAITTAQATWNISLDLDGRASYSSQEKADAELHAAGLLIRKTFADSKGDRLTFTVLGEAYDTFRELMLHEAWMRYKGPMGKWNVTAGRMGLPYGLLPSFSTTRLLFTTWYESTIGFDVDNGILLSGVLGDFDYGVAVTQGLGPHNHLKFPGNGLITGRAGVTMGDGGEFQLGASFIAGNVEVTHMEHMDPMKHQLFGGGLDGTASLGVLTLRASLDGGQKDDNYYLTGFGYSEYALTGNLDINLGLKAEKKEHHRVSGSLYTGCTIKTKILTIRGAYSYEHAQKDHRFGLQLYRLFSVTF